MKEKKKPEGRARRRDFRSRSGNAPKHEADAAKKNADQWQVGGGLLLWKFPIDKLGCTLKSITSIIYIHLIWGVSSCRGNVGKMSGTDWKRNVGRMSAVHVSIRYSIEICVDVMSVRCR